MDGQAFCRGAGARGGHTHDGTSRPQVSGSASSRRIEATCTVNGDEQACGGTQAGVLRPGRAGPIIVNSSPVLIPAVIPAGIPGLGARAGGRLGQARLWIAPVTTGAKSRAERRPVAVVLVMLPVLPDKTCSPPLTPGFTGVSSPILARV